MEKVYQAVGEEGLRIPISLMRKYGLDPGSGVVLELEDDGIRVVPARMGRTAIENRALRYLIGVLGDAVSVEALVLPDDEGWMVKVYGAGLKASMGRLFYSEAGSLLPERSTPPSEMRVAATRASTP